MNTLKTLLMIVILIAGIGLLACLPVSFMLGLFTVGVYLYNICIYAMYSYVGVVLLVLIVISCIIKKYTSH